LKRDQICSISLNEMTDFDPKGKKILVISAHPDDLDFCAGGTLLKWLGQGAKAAIVICTNGDKGTEDKNLDSQQLAKIRQTEQLEASKMLDLDKTWFLNYPDAHLEATAELKEKIVRLIREYQPDVVMSFDPTERYSLTKKEINHPDHLAVGEAALSAVYPLARDFLTFPEHQREGLRTHKVKDLFLYNFDKPNFWVDITDLIKLKSELLAKHPSQCTKSEIEGELEKWNARAGKEIGVSYAESFIHLEID